MRVDRVEAFAVRYAEPNNNGKIRSLTPGPASRPATGSSAGARPSPAARTPRSRSVIVERRLAPLRGGARPARRRGDLGAIRDATYWDGNGGIVTFGISAIDMALWDLAGRIGGRCRSTACWAASAGDRVPACASIIFDTGNLERHRPRVRRLRRAQGYRVRQGRLGPRSVHRLRPRRASATSPSRAPCARRSAPDAEIIVDVVGARGLDREPRHPDGAARSTTRSASTGSRTRCRSSDLDG